MTTRVSYSQPRRINAFSLTLLALAGIFAYWMWRFFPAYFDAWSVDHVLRESAAEVYRVNHLNSADRSKAFREIVEKAKHKIQNADQIHIGDPDLEVKLDVDDDTEMATMTCDYQVVIALLPTKKTKTIEFHRKESVSVKKVTWE